jgi:murein DD-endopeptidase MepM/ murein hydrolase activator NlpD
MSKKQIPPSILILSVACVALVVGGIVVYRMLRGHDPRGQFVWDYLRDPAAHQDWAMEPQVRCGDAPFLFPTHGFVGYLWDDSFRIGHRHQGLDIFAGTGVGITPVYAAYDGYLTRLADWKSSVIQRIPSDPLEAGRQIWLYYTHMASPDGVSYIVDAFPPGTSEVFVTAGTLLGYQGNYSGDPNNPVGVHLHFSIVRDNGSGQFLNELDINNTLDPSPYFGLPLNGKTNHGVIPLCGAQ